MDSIEKPQSDYPSFSMVIPAYNEDAGVALTIDDLRRDLEKDLGAFEIIVVNDGSKERTGGILRARNDIRSIEHVRNQGYGAALKTGILAAHSG